MPDEALRDCQRQSAGRSRTIILLSLLANHKQAAQCPLLPTAGAFNFERRPRHGSRRLAMPISALAQQEQTAAG
jgi:hypothetical protein